MMRHGGRACALALALIGLAGCMPDSLYMKSQVTTNGEEQVIVGSLEVVTERTEDALKKLGVTYETEPEGDGLRIRATTAKNGHFSLLLTREGVQGKKSEQVRVHFQWESGPKDPVQVLIFGTLEAFNHR
jgi:hypothetical protein